MRRVVLLAAGCAACASVPEQEASITRGGVLEVSTDETLISGDGFAFAFASTGVRLPVSLQHGNNVEIFGEGACPSPSRAGASIEPLQTAVGERDVPGLDPANNTLAVTLRGPAIVQMEVAYDVPYTCAGPQSLRGTSTFTVFPSGKIVRHDRVQPSTGTMIVNAAGCSACDGMQRDAKANVFWALAAGGTRSIIAGGSDSLIGKADVDTVFSCAAYDTHTVAVAWNDVPTAHASESMTGTLLYAHDFAPPASTVSQAIQTASSTLLVLPDRHPCTELAEQRRLPKTLTLFDGTDHDLVLDAFEIYTDTTPRRGRITIEPRNGESISGGIALRLALGAPKHLSVRAGNGEKVSYLVQEDGVQSILWIDGGIPAGGAIIIEAM